MQPKSAALKKAEAQNRENFAELCYWYPQYEIEDFATGGKREDMPIGDIELLLNVARKQYYQDKLDTLYVLAAAQSNKGFRSVKQNLLKLIKKIGARI